MSNGFARLEIKWVALITLFFIGWDEGAMTMQVGEVARIRVVSLDMLN